MSKFKAVLKEIHGNTYRSEAPGEWYHINPQDKINLSGPFTYREMNADAESHPCTVKVTYRDGHPETITNGLTEYDAKALCREEVKWESTARVTCPELDINETGDFVEMGENV